MDTNALFKLSYGLFVLSAKDGGKQNGCIINTVTQVANEPLLISIAVNKENLTHDMIEKNGVFNISVLSEDVPFSVFEHFGFQSGKDTDKFAGFEQRAASENGLFYLSQWANSLISAKVTSSMDCGSHTLFLAQITEARILSDGKSVTYQYYFDHIKPAPATKKTGFVCKICGYIHQEDTLPDDFVCPICKHPASDFEKIK
ncbi:MAG: flavin reductase [Oscillospiraceae bacterium]|nr:flavin reductase [Oscillospiraceae bacterium]